MIQIELWNKEVILRVKRDKLGSGGDSKTELVKSLKADNEVVDFLKF